MSGEETAEPPKGTAFDNVSSGGKKTSDDVPSLCRQIARHKQRRYEDWAFFTLYIIFLSDFVFFTIIKVFWLPCILCLIQFFALCCLIWKKGSGESLKLANSFLSRIVTDNPVKSDFTEGDKIIPFMTVSVQKDSSEELVSLKTAREQDWFVFTVLNFIFLDVIFFSVFNNWAAPISLLILEGFALFALAEKMGMAAIRELISKFLSSASGKMGK